MSDSLQILQGQFMAQRYGATMKNTLSMIDKPWPRSGSQQGTLERDYLWSQINTILVWVKTNKVIHWLPRHVISPPPQPTSYPQD